MTEYYDNNLCFVCGNSNSNGLQLNFAYNRETETVQSKVKFQDQYQGWANVIHGGLISTVLDEIMVKAAESKNYKCVTAEINVKFKQPALADEIFHLSGKIIEIRNRLIQAESKMTDSDHRTIAIATAKLFIVN